MSIYPTQLEYIDTTAILIFWNDGEKRQYTFRELRDACPCATCREKSSADQQKPAELLPVLTPQQAQPLRITGMKPVGNYGYSIQFSDGHDTGIFTMDRLRELGQKQD